MSVLSWKERAKAVPEAAWEELFKRGGKNRANINVIIEQAFIWKLEILAAELIAKYEPETLADRETLWAREVCAKRFPDSSADYKSGMVDDWSPMITAKAAITYAIEQIEKEQKDA